MQGIQITEFDVISASLAQYRLSLTNRKILVGTGVMLLSVISVNVPYSVQDPLVAWIISACAAVWLLSLIYNLIWGVRRIARSQYRELASYRETFKFQWTEDRLRIWAGANVSDMRWSDLFAWYRYDGGYLLYPSSKMYFLVPDRALKGEASESLLRAGLEAGAVPERRLFRKLPSRAS